MKLIIDTNRLIASLIKNSISRKILLYKGFEFISPEIINEDIQKYKQEIISKANITNENFAVLLNMLMKQIVICQKVEYKDSLDEAKSLIIDIGDVPFIALALAVENEGIWSDDKH